MSTTTHRIHLPSKTCNGETFLASAGATDVGVNSATPTTLWHSTFYFPILAVVVHQDQI